MACDYQPLPTKMLRLSSRGCQIDSSGPFTGFDGQQWCDFHLPYEDSAENKSSKAEWDENKINEFNNWFYEIVKTGTKRGSSTLDLRGGVFPGDIDMRRDWNSKKVSFAHCRFYGNIEAKYVFFPAQTEFSYATFRYSADFQGAVFRDEVWFHGAEFKGVVRFDGELWPAGRRLDVDPGEGKDLPFITFDYVTFHEYVSFQNRIFTAQASFDNCRFEVAPAFHGCILHQAATFPSIEFFPDTTSTGAVGAYRTLKLAMERVRSRDEEAMFYALEQKSRRHQKDTPHSVKFFSYLYERTADYGRSFTKPIACFAILTVLFLLFYFAIALAMSSLGVAFDQSVTFTMMQVVRPFSVWQPTTGDAIIELVMPPHGKWSTLVKLTATFQSLFSLSLVTLFLLALRRRFKLG